VKAALEEKIMPSNGTQTDHIFLRYAAPFATLALALMMNGAPQNAAGTSHQGVSTGPAAADTGFAQSCANPHFPTETPAAIDATTCGIAGNGGADTWQNEAKNNFCATDPAKPIAIPDMVQLQSKVQEDQSIPFGNPRQHPLTSSAGPAKDRVPLRALGEGNQVVLKGFVRIARQEGAESVNCGSHVPADPGNHDIHISIVQNPDDSECSGVVVEMTPHHRPTEWNQSHVQDVAAAHLLVRVTGQLMFDSSHTPCVGGTSIKGDPARASLWEVHPIYKFEVCPKADCSSDSDWLPLEAWKKT
jgi:hypothetical protein